MMALNAISLAVVCTMVLVKRWEAILSQGPGILLSACIGTYAGALVASPAARRTAARP